jgi:uncharacterized protein (TIGR02646 family)
MRPIDKNNLNGIEYSPYGTAKDDLIATIGSFCSYCERRGYESALDVEHVIDKASNPKLEEKWDNFLLACKNCNSIKGRKKVDLSKVLLPHLNDTFSPFEYGVGGSIRIKDSIPQELKSKTQKLIDLVGLLRRPGAPSYSNKDKRWKDRLEVDSLARRYHDKYIEGNIEIEDILNLAEAKGFWSVWMTVFKDVPKVKQALIDGFPGTNKDYDY